MDNILSMNSFSFFRSPKDISMELSGRVRSRRKEMKLSQAELARRSDVSLGSIKRFERTGEISLSSLIKIGFVLNHGSDFDSLFSKKGYRSIEEVINEDKR